MFLSDSAIQRALRSGRLRVSQILGQGLRIQPSSVELHLGREFKTFPDYNGASAYIDPLEDQMMVSHRIEDGSWFTLGPRSFALGHTIETIGVDRTLAAQVDGKSSLARLGLQIHMTSGFIDPGFEGQITLEFFNAAPRPMKLWPKMVIAQLFVIPLRGEVERPYGSPGIDSRYQGQIGAQPSLYGAGKGDVELPGMWEEADFTGGADEVRPPVRTEPESWLPSSIASPEVRRKVMFGEHVKACCTLSVATDGKSHSHPCERDRKPLTQLELATLSKEELNRRLLVNGGKVYASGWPLDSEARNADHHPGRGGW